MDRKKIESLLVSKTDTIKYAMQQLNESAEKILFVIDNSHKLLGTLTDGDIRRGLINGIEFTDSIEQIMNFNFVSLKYDDKDIESIATQLITENKIEQIPLLDERGKIKDIIFWTDLIRTKQKKPIKLLPNTVVIMAGGKGTRLDPFTKILPKPLIPIGEKPAIEIIMDKYYQSGFYNFTFTLNYKKEYIKLYLREANYPYKIDFVEEEKVLGTIGVLSLIKDKLRETFFVANCDSLLDIDFIDVMNWHKQHKADITIIGCHNEVKIPFGVLKMSEGKLSNIMEKPSHDIIINTGVYVIEPSVIAHIPENERYDMNQLINNVIDEGKKVSVYTITNGWFDIGQWKEYNNNITHLNELLSSK